MNLPKGIISMQIALISIAAAYLILLFSFHQFQEYFMFFPDSLPRKHNYTHPNFEREFFVKSGKNEINYALFSKGKSDSLCVYFHGNAHNIEHYSQFINPILEKGVDVLIVDYPTFGKSTGKIYPDVFYEVAMATQKFIGDSLNHKTVTVYGKSLGTGVATYFAQDFKVDKIILETPYEKFSNAVGRLGAIFPTDLMIRYRLNNVTNLKNSEVPVYIIHGTSDFIIKYQEAEKIKSAYPNRVKLTLVEKGKHNNLTEFPEYQKFIDEAFQ